jgi:hypothetical protein
MRHPARQPRATRTRTVDLQHEATALPRRSDGKAVGAFGGAVRRSLRLPRAHTARCREGGRRTRHSHYGRLRVRGRSLWRRQGTTCQAGCTGLPPCVVRYRQRRPETARDALVAPHGGLSLAWGAALDPLSPLAR